MMVTCIFYNKNGFYITTDEMSDFDFFKTTQKPPIFDLFTKKSLDFELSHQIQLSVSVLIIKLIYIDIIIYVV